MAWGSGVFGVFCDFRSLWGFDGLLQGFLGGSEKGFIRGMLGVYQAFEGNEPGPIFFASCSLSSRVSEFR